MLDAFNRALTQLGVLTSRPGAFVVVGAYVVLWLSIEPASLDMHGIATLATWIMTLLIQRSEHRDTQAIHAKLDELLHANQGADNALTKTDNREPEEIERYRDQHRFND